MRYLAFALAAVVVVLAGCGKKGEELTIKGSDTMLHVGEGWAERFRELHPDVQVAVTGGGSGTGISAIINGHTQVAMASRTADQNEKEAAEKQGKPLKEFVVGKDGIAVVVNKVNPVSELTIVQLKKIFTGEITNWKQVGGADKDFVIYSRDTSSGSYVFFREHVLGNQEYVKSALRMAATAALVDGVAGNEGAIGYSGLAYAQEGNVKILPVKRDSDSEAVSPSEATIRDGSYPVSRPLMLYTLGEPKGQADSFIKFALGDEGQKILKGIGYVPIH